MNAAEALPVWVKAILLGLVEGITEFIPVSSTGHLIVAGEWLGYTGPQANTFTVFIQLGAILAVMWLYRRMLWSAVARARQDPAARRLFANLAIAFVPAAAIGFLVEDWIDEYLFHTETVAAALIIGGIAILLVERLHRPVTVETVDELPPRKALGVGLAQVLALIPGVSRSGATIMGGYAIGLSRQAATEFSFLLAIPIMIAATFYKLFKERALLGAEDVPIFAVGFITAFLSALVVIQVFLRFVGKHSFVAFAWYRIGFGFFLLSLWWLEPR
ncbi:MAG TPA: undecaprenyl-diphosphate phosphatase [Gemmatimonadales bacterium]|nr:undecaprenyl-diphosphate phosphatase [Gemmatimonadales bacterium]